MKKFQKILLVDDDNITNFVNHKLLTNWKLAQEVSYMTDARKALDMLEQQCGQDTIPDLILLDLNMPVFDGFDFLEHFRMLPLTAGTTEVVVLTSSTAERDKERVKELGFDKFISKPLTLEKMQGVWPVAG